MLFVRCSVCACLDLSVSSSFWVWEGLRFVIVALPGLFSYLFFFSIAKFLFDSINIVHTSHSLRSFWDEFI